MQCTKKTLHFFYVHPSLDSSKRIGHSLDLTWLKEKNISKEREQDSTLSLYYIPFFYQTRELNVITLLVKKDGWNLALFCNCNKLPYIKYIYNIFIHTYLYYSFFSSSLHITFNTTISSLTLSFFWWMRIVEENVKARYLRLTFLLAFSFQCQFWKTRRDIHTCPNIHSDPFFTTEQKKTVRKGERERNEKAMLLGL